MEDPKVSDQAAEAGDDQTVDETGQTVSVIPQEDAGTTTTTIDTKKENEEAKDWRKSDKEWQETKEKAKKGEDAARILESLAEALNIKKEGEEEEEADPLTLVTKKVDELQTELALSKWEKAHPAVDSAENREAWQDIVKSKGHLVKSGDLTYDDLWAMVRKGGKPSTSNQDFKDQELNIGSIPAPSKTTVTGTEIDPDVYQAMKNAGFTDEQIKSSV